MREQHSVFGAFYGVILFAKAVMIRCRREKERMTNPKNKKQERERPDNIHDV